MIQKLTGYEIITSDIVDARFHKTKAEMKSTIDALTPSPYPCWCTDDGNMYIYNVNNSVDAVTGKYKLFGGGSSSNLSAGTAIAIDSANTINVLISTTEGNKLTSLTDGLYVSAETINISANTNNESGETLSSLTIGDKVYLILDKVGELSALTTSAQSSAVSAINEIVNRLLKDEIVDAAALCDLDMRIGAASALTTTDKTNLVNAINELKNITSAITNYSGSTSININSANTISLNISSSSGNIITLLEDGIFASASTLAISANTNIKSGETLSSLTINDKSYLILDKVGELSALTTSAKTNAVSAINEIIDDLIEDEFICSSALYDLNSKIGPLSALTTTERENLVAAINELKELSSGSTEVSANTGIESGDVLSSITINDKSYLIKDKVGELSALTVSAQSCVVSAINEVIRIILEDERIHASAMDELEMRMGDPSDLETEEKYCIVDAINELYEMGNISGGTSGSSKVSANTGIESGETLSSLTIGHNNYIVRGGDAVMPSGFTTNITVGGITSGTRIGDGESLASIIKNMLWKYMAPKATLTLSPSTSYYNILTSSADTTITLTGSYTVGTNPEPYTLTYFGNGNELSGTPKTYKTNNTTGVANTHGNMVNTFKYNVNDGTTDVPATKTISYIYPKYYGLSASIGVTPTAEDVINAASVVLGVDKGYTPAAAAGTNVREVYAYLKSYGALTSILNPSKFEYLTSFTRSEVTINGKAYYVYVANVAHTISSTYKLTFI